MYQSREIIKYPAYEKDFEEVKEELTKLKSEQSFTADYLRRILSTKVDLRKTFEAVIIKNPARKQEIKEHTFVSDKTIYNHLWKLKELGLIDMIPVMKIWNRDTLTACEETIIIKFKTWTLNMPESQRQYFAAKTKYYTLTELGKSKEIVNFVLLLLKQQVEGDNEI